MVAPSPDSSAVPPKTGLVQSVGMSLSALLDAARRQPLNTALVAALVLVLAYFYGFVHSFGPKHANSAFTWLVSTWNPRTGYEHGFLVPFLFLILVARRLPLVLAAPVRPSAWGLVAVLFGALCFVAAVRTFQPRVALGGLPFIVLGGLAWWRGWASARLLAFPVMLLYFVIPVPGMIQATNGLQLLATKSAYHLSTLFGISASLSGNDIYSVPMGKWNFNIAEGCSGVRSLMALTLVSAVYAHLTQKTLWKKIVLFSCSVPLAILSNCLRVASILIVAEYFSADFAAKTYHEGSGFLFFLIVGLTGLSAVDWLLNHRGRRKVVIRRTPAVSGGEGPVAPSTTS
jgi:exosortase